MTRGLFTVAFILLVGAPTAGAQDLRQIRELYELAAYEDALKAMPEADPAGGNNAGIEKYRALCLLALGREKEAASAVERLVRQDPLFTPSSADVSPRMQAFFAEVRGSLLPAIIKRSYAGAKAAYESAARREAHAGFKRTMDLIDSLPEDARGTLADLRMLAGEFFELTAPPPPAPLAPVSALPDPAKEAEAPKDTEPVEYREPQPILEQLPAWTPPDPVAARSEFVGVLRVFIGEDGQVESARVVQGSHPAYDAVALRLAKTWTYTPATRAGQPVSSTRDIRIRLVPR